jgi:hypothetical protein
VIYAHVRPDQTMVDVDNTRTLITPEHLQDWCQQAGTTVTVKPVIDLNEEISTDAYQPTEKQKEQTRLRWPTCPFPFCDRPSWRQGPNADNDHITEHPAGETTSSNLAPAVPRTPPAEDLHRLDLPTHPRRRLGMDQPAGPPTYRLNPTPPTTAGGVRPMPGHRFLGGGVVSRLGAGAPRSSTTVTRSLSFGGDHDGRPPRAVSRQTTATRHRNPSGRRPHRSFSAHRRR